MKVAEAVSFYPIAENIDISTVMVSIDTMVVMVMAPASNVVSSPFFSD